MKAQLSYKSKRNIIIAIVIIALLAIIATATYFFVKGNDDTSAFTGNNPDASQQEQGGNNGQNPTNPVEPGQEGNQDPVVNPDGDNNPGGNNGGQTTNPVNPGTTTPGQNGGTTNNGTTGTTTNPNVPNEEYVTERREEQEVLVSQNYMLEWGRTALAATTTNANIVTNRSIIRPIITADKIADKAAAIANDIITYTISVKNVGTANGTAVVKDTMPSTFTDGYFVEGSIKVTGTDKVKVEGNEVTDMTTLTAEDLAKGIEVEVAKQEGENPTEVTISFQIKLNENVTGVVSNIAEVNGEETKPVDMPVITYTKSVDKTEMSVTDTDKTLTYTITATNKEDVAGKVVVKDTIPEGTEFVAESIELNGTKLVDENGNALTAEDLANGIEIDVPAKRTVELTFKVTVVDMTKTISNIAYVNDQPTDKPVDTKIKAYIVFEENGGSEVADMTGYAGEKIADTTMPATTKTGYDFAGWYLSENLEGEAETALLEAYKEGTTTYYAKWTPATNTEYTVRHHQQNIADDEYTLVDTDNMTGTTGEQTAAVAKSYDGFTAQSFEQKTIAADGSTIVDIYYNRNTYTVTYVDGVNGSAFANQENKNIKYGATTPEFVGTPERTGYEFKGWEPAVAGTVTENATYTATWEASTNTAYTVRHHQQNIADDGYTLVDTDNMTGTTGEQTAAVAKSYDGFTAQSFEQKTIAADGSTIVDIYYNRNTYTVTYVDGVNGTAFASQENKGIKYGMATPEFVGTPERTGYEFKGWEPAVAGTVTEDATYTATWEASTNTAYTVRHHQQNIADDGYTLVDTDNMTGTTGELTAAVAKSYDGFTAQSFEQKTIAADGSTIVDIYYNRNTYTVTYVDGVNGTAFASQENKNIKYGATTPEFVGTPERTGYEFKGWEPAVAGIVTEDATYTATWEASTNTEYTVRHHQQNIADDGYTLVDTDNMTGTTGEQTAAVAKSYDGFTAQSFEQKTIAADGSTIVDIYYKRNTYTVTYVDGVNGTAFASQENKGIRYGMATPEFVGTPERIGYEFKGWTPTVAGTVTEDATYTAKWEAKTYNYKVQYWYENLEGEFVKDEQETIPGTAKYGDVITDYTDKAGDAYVLSKVEPTKNNKVSLTITENEETNVINVYYIRNSFDYKVVYYKDSVSAANKLGETATSKEKVGTVMTNELVTEDFGETWLNAKKPVGYQNGTATYITIKANNNNVINVVYKPRTDIKYTVKYYFNEVEDTSKAYEKTTTFGTKVENVTDYSNNGEWSKDTSKSTKLPYTIAAVSGNVIKVYYVKPDISVKKTSNAPKVVEHGDKITYTITATNKGLKEGTVKIADTVPTGTKLTGKITATGYENVTEKELADGITLTVPANGTAKIQFTVEITNVKPGSSVINIPTVNDKKDEDNTVTDKVEKTVPVTAKTTTLSGFNIVLVLDTSGSMDEHTPTTEKCPGGFLHVHGGIFSSCVEQDGEWYVASDKTRMDVAKEVTCNFIDKVNITAGSDISIVRFANSASVVGSTTNLTKQALKDKVNGLSADGGTVMSSALATAKSEIDNNLKKTNPNNKNIVIFISDGVPEGDNTNTIRTNAATLKTNNTATKADDVTVYTVAFGSNISILKDTIATDASKYYTTSNTNGLGDILADIQEDVTGTPNPTQSSNGKIALTGVYADNEGNKGQGHPIIIKVNGKEDSKFTSLSDATASGKIVLKDGVYYLDLTQFEAGADVSIEYFAK